MRDARLDGRWHRSGTVAALGLLLAATGTVTNQGCGDDTTPPDNPTTTTTTGPGAGGTGGTGGSGGTGATGGAGGTGGVNNDFTIAPAAFDATEFYSPFDATPDPDGLIVYFTGLNPNGDSGVFQVPAAGGPITELAVGDPFVSPFGIAISSDGTQLFIADVGAQTSIDDDAGLIFVLPTAGGAPSVLAGGGSTRAASLEVHVEAGEDYLYFSGIDNLDRLPGIFKIPAGGAGAPEIVSKDPVIQDPSGIVVATDGTIYFADTIAGANGSTTVYVINTAGIKSLATGLRVGYPAGVGLTFDETQLMVSGLDPVTGTDAVYIYDVADPTIVSTLAFPANIAVDTFTEPAGLHRARNRDTFAWADSRAGGTGTVFVISK